jgi:hypothetical protein
MTLYHGNGNLAWRSEDERAIHYNGDTAYLDGVARHLNGQTAYINGVAYHSNGRTAYINRVSYSEDGKILNTNGYGIKLELGPNIEILVAEDLFEVIILKEVVKSNCW